MYLQLLTLPLILTILTSAHSTPAPTPTHFNFNFGGSKATILSDGQLVFPTLPYNVPNRAVLRAYRENFQSVQPIVLAQNILVIDLPSGRVMIDTGSFNLPQDARFQRAGRLFENMEKADISPESIDAVLLSHAHLDHVAGLAMLDGSAAFPNATVYINRRDHEFWSADELAIPSPLIPVDLANFMRTIYLQRIAPYQASGRFRIVEDDESPLEGVKFIPTNGHSPGHTSIEITSGGRRLICVGDAWVSKADQVQNPEWSLFIETDPEIAYTSRMRLLMDAVRSRDLVLVYHESFPGLGYVKKLGPFFDWLPAGQEQLASVAPTREVECDD